MQGNRISKIFCNSLTKKMTANPRKDAAVPFDNYSETFLGAQWDGHRWWIVHFTKDGQLLKKKKTNCSVKKNAMKRVRAIGNVLKATVVEEIKFPNLVQIPQSCDLAAGKYERISKKKKMPSSPNNLSAYEEDGYGNTFDSYEEDDNRVYP